MTSIMLLGSDTDCTMRYMRTHMVERGVPFDYIDVSEVSQFAQFRCSDDFHTLTFDYGGKHYDLSQYRSFYQRFWPTKEMMQAGGAPLDVMNSILGYLALSSAVVVNRPQAGYSNISKLLHLDELEAFGFDVPESVCVNTAPLALKYLDHGGAWVTKGVSSHRTRAHQLDLSEFAYFDRLRYAPVLFQKRITGRECRVHLVGDAVLPLRIDTKCVDYRYAARDGYNVEFTAAIKLPELLISRCRDYCRKAGLVMAGFDFVQCAKTRKWILLEVNPAPGFDYYDAHLGRKIVEHLTNWLEQGSESRSFVDEALDHACCEVGPFIGSERRVPVTY
jgi:glutathione synthase/RimK-type ligase-like ATP-grasp enzyme